MKLSDLNFRDPSSALRIVLGTLVLLNLVAAGMLVFPPGGSPEQMQTQLQSLQMEILKGKSQLQRTRTIAGKVDRGRNEGDQFMDQYFLNSASTYSTIVNELVSAAKRANIKFKEHSYITEPIEGSEDLTMMSITGAYEGSYADLLHYINEIDRTKRLLIIENLTAQPQQGTGGVLGVSIRFDTFVKEKPALPQANASGGNQIGAGE